MTDKAGTARTLYQFPQSHFAEKGRWLLDYKGLDYQARNLYPVLNRLFPLAEDRGHDHSGAE